PSLRFISTKEVSVTERGDDVLVVVQDFIEHAVTAAHVKKHDRVLVGTAAFAMDIAGRGGLVHAGRTDLLECAVRFIKPMLALHDECIVMYHMPMQNDLFVCREFEQHMYDVGSLHRRSVLKIVSASIRRQAAAAAYSI